MVNLQAGYSDLRSQDRYLSIALALPAERHAVRLTQRIKVGGTSFGPGCIVKKG